MKLHLSIIIPVYNSGRYLHECIESLLKQRIELCEFIFVNDGSLDSSKNIIEEYQKIDSRIILLNQENSGVSVARNSGINLARGQYISFVDADDFVSIDYYGKILEEAISQDVDILVSQYFLGRDNKYIKVSGAFEYGKIYFGDSIRKNILEGIISEKELLLLPVWNKLYRANFLKANNLEFSVKLRIEEDILFNIKALVLTKDISFTTICGYYYRDNSSSVSKGIVREDFFDNLIDNFRFDLHPIIGKNFDKLEIYKLKSIKLVSNCMFYLYKSAVDKQISAVDRSRLYKKIILSPDVSKSAIQFKSEILKNKGIFDKILLFIIENKWVNVGYLLGYVLNKIYTPKFSEFFRFINKKLNVFNK